MNNEKHSYPINYVAKQCGLTTHTIRMWERRYGAVEPARTDSSHRLYSEEDINRLRLLHRVTESGYTISKMAKLSNDELRSLLRDAQASQYPKADQPKVAGNAKCNDYLVKCQNAASEMNRDELDQLLMQASLEFSPPELLQGLVSPFLQWVGDEWHAGTMRVAHEHLASATVRAFLERIRRTVLRTEGAPRITVTTFAGQKHEIGAQMVSIIAALDGWHDFYFGPDMPAAEIAKAAIDTQSKAVAISGPLTGNEGKLLQEIIDLKEYLPKGVTIIAGGPGVAMLRDNLKILNVLYADNLDGFREILSKLNA